MQVAKNIGKIPMHEVEAHNIIPTWIASEKREYGARTIRSKIHKQLPEWFKVAIHFAASQSTLSSHWAAAVQQATD